MQKLILPFIGFLSFVSSAVPLAAAPLDTTTTPAALGADSDYGKVFDPWRANNRALKAALHGDEDAQIAFFLSAYVRVSQPYAGGEDLEQMTRNITYLLAKLGDAAFVKALEGQRPEVRSAVRWFFEVDKIQKGSPKTWQLFQAAPKIDWPIDKAIRKS